MISRLDELERYFNALKTQAAEIHGMTRRQRRSYLFRLRSCVAEIAKLSGTDAGETTTANTGTAGKEQ